MFLKQPYDSQSLLDLDRNKLTFLVNRYIITDYAHILNNDNLKQREFKKGNLILNPVILYGFTKGEEDIPELQFPLVNYEKNWILFDMRKHYAKAKSVHDIKLKSNFDTDIVVLRNKLAGLWSVGYVKEFSLMDAPRQVFSSWLSHTLSNFKSLQIVDKLVIQVLCEIYYYRLFSEKGVRNKNEKQILMSSFRKRSVSDNFFEAVYNKADDLDTLEDLCRLIGEVPETDRLKGFTVGVLLNLIKYDWIGIDQEEFIALSLEYPPFFTTMVYTALTSAGHKRSRIGQSAVNIPRNMSTEFVTMVSTFLRQHVGG